MSDSAAGTTVCVEGLALPEGAPAFTRDGRVVFVEIYGGRVSAFDPASRRCEPVADVGGGPNAVVLADAASGAAFALTQNGGVAGSWRSPDPREPGIQLIDGDGTVRYLCTSVAGEGLVAPNDLCYDATGTLYFTDPAEGYAPDHPQADGRIYLIGPAGETYWDIGPVFPNGIVWTGDSIVWTESYTERVVRRQGDRNVIVAQLPDGHVPDGLDVGPDGTLYVTTCFTGGVVIIRPDGDQRFLALGDGVYTTNCALVPDGSLYVTDGGDLRPELPAGKLWHVSADAVVDCVRAGPAAVPVRHK